MVNTPHMHKYTILKGTQLFSCYVDLEYLKYATQIILLRRFGVVSNFKSNILLLIYQLYCDCP
jgi:hypothetical protein